MSTPSARKTGFTKVRVDETLEVDGATTLASTLSVTGAITATGGVSGAITGNVTGNVTGALFRTVTPVTAASLALNTTHDVLVCDTTSNAIALTLPAASASGKEYTVLLRTDGGNNVTLTSATGDTLDGTNNTATFADAEDALQIIDIANDRWLILENIGSVGLSSV